MRAVSFASARAYPRARVETPIDEWTEVLGALSLATDLANGHDYEKTLRSCVLAVRLAEAMGYGEGELRDVFHASLLRYVGCSSFAHEEALLFGDEIAARKAYATVDPRRVGQIWRASGEAVQAEPSAVRRALRRGSSLLRAPASLRDLIASQCEVGMRFAARLSLGAEVTAALGQIHERWDGAGGPTGLQGEQLAPVARVVQVAHLAELVHQRLGLEAAVDVIGQRGGSALAPEACDAFTTRARELLSPTESAWDDFVQVGLRFPVIDAERTLDEVVEVFADLVDLSSVHTLGHSRAVAHSATKGGEHLGLSAEELVDLRRAALLHDLGRLAVPASVWNKREPLTASDWERIRLHAYQGARILARAPSLARVAAIACADHERCDGSGYPKTVDASALPPAARILAAADVHCALLEDRPHRPAHSPSRAEAELRHEAERGRLDPTAVEAVLGCRPRAARRDASLPAQLTAREAEVVSWVARGETNKEVAGRLGISPRTVGHHLAHAFEKIGVSTRAALALFAVEHDLVAAPDE